MGDILVMKYEGSTNAKTQIKRQIMTEPKVILVPIYNGIKNGIKKRPTNKYVSN